MNEHNSNSKIKKRKIGYNKHTFYKDGAKSVAIETKRDIEDHKKKLRQEKREKKMNNAAENQMNSNDDEQCISTGVPHSSFKEVNFTTPSDPADGGSTYINGNMGSNIEVTQDNSSIVYHSSERSNFQSAGIDVYQFTESRVYEIMNLRSALSNASFMGKKRVFQTLPRHMRRRAASHDVKRIPRRLQQIAMWGNDVPSKPARKYKRCPDNLIQEYSRRCKVNSWLETHIWHAKRFLMKDKWGYRVPVQPSDKSFRAMYRATAKSCLLQDKSYMEVVEVIGSTNDLICGLGRLTSPDGISLNDEKCLTSQYYGETVLYVHDSYPYDVIGPALFVWTTIEETNQRKLVLIIHPSTSEQVLKEMGIIFDIHNYHLDDKKSGSESNLCSDLEDKSESVKLQNDTKDTTQEKRRVNIMHHKLDFVLFSLTGPQSAQLLQNVLKIPKKNQETNEAGSNHKARRLWICSKEGDSRKIYNIVVEDPRFYLPHKKRDPFRAGIQNESAEKVSSDALVSEIWDESVRMMAKEEKLTNQQINEMRHQQLIPASKLAISSPAIPVVIMERVSEVKDGKNYGSGFDVLLPSGWGMPFWIALVYQGACVGGIEVDESIALERLSPHFPSHFPDTSVYHGHAQVLLKERLKKHTSHPPDKRVNYTKLGFKSPFAISWEHVVSEWKHTIKYLMGDNSVFPDNFKSSRGHQGFYVLREKRLLNFLHQLLIGEGKDDVKKKSVISELFSNSDALIPICVTPQGSRIPKENASLCIPRKSDIPLLYSNRKKRDRKPNGYSEPCHKGRVKGFPYVCKEYGILLPNAATIGGNTRWIIGYIQSGSYSFTRGRGSGVGFLSAVGLAYMLHTCPSFELLFRNTNTFEYSFCTFDIFS